VSPQFERLPQVVQPGDRIMIDDGLLELQVVSTSDIEVVAQVVTGGVVHSNKGLNLPRADLSIPAITEKDRDDLRFAIEQGADWVALSFVRAADEVLDLKAYARSSARPSDPVIAKIRNRKIPTLKPSSGRQTASWYAMIWESKYRPKRCQCCRR
jgi:pyruvate kinase